MSSRRGFALAAVLAVGALLTLLAWQAVPSAQALCSTPSGTPKLVTDKADYPPGDTVHIDGCGFQSYAGQTLSIHITDPNMSVTSDTVLIGGSGTFTYDHVLPVNASQGQYLVEVKNGGGTTIASTTFTDGAIDFQQCRNDSDDNSAIDDCEWTTGAINGSNSAFEEGDVVPQRLFNRIDFSGSHTMVFEYDFTKADVYAYDFMSDVDETQAGALLRPCQNAPNFASSGSGNCNGSNALYTGAVAVTVPADSFGPASVAGHPAEKVSDAERADNPPRQFLVGCNPGPCTGLSVHSITHIPATTCLRNCGTSSVEISFTFTTPADDTLVGVWFGGHLAEGADPDAGSSPPDGWGSGCAGGSCGSSAISG